MLAPTRHRQLLDILNERGSVRTAEIARELDVTEETIRRDFEKLEKEGALLRAHGGALRLEPQRREIPVKDRAVQNAPAKRAIGKAAARLVEPGQTVFLDPSTTVQQMAKLVDDQPFTILTTSLQIPQFFVTKPSVQVVVLGGNFRGSSLSCTGYPAELVMDLYRIDAAFISCRGIDPKFGLSEATEEQARLKRHVISRSSRIHLLADSSKGNVSSTHCFARLPDINTWFTEAEPEAALASQLRSQGVEITVCR